MALNSPNPAGTTGTVTGARVVFVRALLLLTLVADIYVAAVSLRGGSVAGCGPSSGCDQVLKSRWAYWFGIPVSIPGLAAYVALFLTTFWFGPRATPRQRRQAWMSAIGLSAAVLLAALWFVTLQVFVLKTICPFCMTAHTAAAIASILLLAKAPVRSPATSPEPQASPGITPRLVFGLVLTALGGLGVLIAGQFVNQPPTYATNTITAGIVTNSSRLPAGAESSAALPGSNAIAAGVAPAPPGPRQFQLFDGKFILDMHEVPVIGNPDAPHTIVSLFDFTCHHCRAMHPVLMEAVRQFSNQVAMIHLPMPLNSSCNPLVKRTLPPHTNACILAALALTVWTADHAAFDSFDEWLFRSPTPPGPDEALAHAQQLVGEAALAKAATNASIPQLIRQDVAIYEAVYRQFHQSSLPEVIIGTNLISGPFNRDRLYLLLKDQFGLVTNSTASAAP